nr:zinc finger, CCHC-type [Tanacetum cinerariifolium]
MQDMSKDGLIPAFDMDTEKCKTCILNKITKKLFQNENSKTEVLELIHSDLCDLHATPSLGNKKYFVTFIDDASRPSLSIPNRTKDIGDSVVLEEVTKEVVTQQPETELKKDKRKRTPKDFRPEFQLYSIKGTRDDDVAFLKEAINDEMDSIMGNNTWVLANLPLGCKPLSCKWIFKRQLMVDGTIEYFKARLVIQGFKQKSGIDYFDTYAPVARISTIRLLIAMASIDNLIIHQMDMKTTFLNGDLDEEVDLTKEFLSLKFSMKDMGDADVILGIRIKHESNGIEISQSHYIKKVLKKFNYFDYTPVGTPMDTSEKLMPNNGILVTLVLNTGKQFNGFRESAVIKTQSSGFEIVNEIKSDVVSPETSYAVYLVYKLPQDESIFEAPLEIVNCNGRNSAYLYIYLVSLLDTPVIREMLDQILHNPVNMPKLNAVPQQRSDSWMEVKVWEFQTPANTNTISMHLWVRHPRNKDLRGLIIQCIKLRST